MRGKWQAAEKLKFMFYANFSMIKSDDGGDESLCLARWRMVDGDVELGAYDLGAASYTFDSIGIINLEALLSLRDQNDNDGMDMGENVLKTGARGVLPTWVMAVAYYLYPT